MSWTVLFTKQAQKDTRKLASASPALQQKAQTLLDLLAVDPYPQPPPYEALVGELRGTCSRRINIQHRLVVQVLEEQRFTASRPHSAAKHGEACHLFNASGCRRSNGVPQWPAAHGDQGGPG